MKVILTQDVEKLGGSHEVVEVADGYARNFLLPRQLAVPATKSAMANLDNMRRVGERRQERLRGASEEQARKLEGQTLVIPAKVGSAGRLYGSIGTADIVKQLKDDFGLELDRKQVLLSEPIRVTGLHPVPLVLHRDVKIQLMVQVGEGGDTASASATPAMAQAAPVEVASVAG
jgi:large subunit ribosomal protein L9